ncbi:antigen identified by monoclonal antibody Ki-67 [Mortierella sp. AD032]|nr:antigen identified by monoclonal antibody Ki-67 [Mortierella sp. AD032]
MSDTPKSPARRQLRKSALQASPFGAPVKSFLSSSSSSAYSTPTATRIKPVSPTMPSLPATADTDDNMQEQGSSSPLDSPSSRKSARISSMYKGMDLTVTPKKPPTTPKSKSHVKIGVWGHIVGLKKQDLNEYCRFPIDKSYCSFGRSSSNDVLVPFESVSDMHCKLIRRDDGEVWLKDTSTIGTLLNNVLVHDTARPIEHNDIMSIAGRNFRFESIKPIPRQPLQATDENIASVRQIKSIQSSIENDISALAEAPSPTAGRISTTPKRNLSRSTAALESSLGVFTPKSAAKLSSLLVSPKPIPLPAFLKSPRKPITSTVEPLTGGTTADSPHDQLEDDDYPGYHTPTKEKRKSTEDFFSELGRTPKKVSFGPDLNPEIFSKHNPPNTPIKRGDHQPLAASTPSFLSKLAAAGGTPKSILTPSRAGGRTNVMQGLEKPTPLKLSLFSPGVQKSVTTPKKQSVVAQSATSSTSRISASEQDDVASDNSANNSDDSIRKKSSSSSTTSPFLDSTSTVSENLNEDDEEEEEDDESPPSTPSRGPAVRQSSATLSTPNRPRLPLSHQEVQEEHRHHCFKLHAPPLQSDVDNPFIYNDESHGDSPSHSPTIAAVQRHHPDMANAIEEELETSLVIETELSPQAELETFTPDINIPDTTPVHTPVRNRTKDDQKSNVTSGGNTPGSASRLALLQLSAQKIRGLPDLLQSPSSSYVREAQEPVPAPVISKGDIGEVETDGDSVADEEAAPVALELDEDNSAASSSALALLESGNEIEEGEQEDGGDEQAEEVETQTEPMIEDDQVETVERDESACNEAEIDADDVSTKDNQNKRSWSSNGVDSKRRSSAPAASTIMRPQSPIFNGLRGVFRTPQKVVESCYAGFTGFRNFMTPTRSLKLTSTELLTSLSKSSDQLVEGGENPFQVQSNDNKEEEAVETLDVQEVAVTKSTVQRGPELADRSTDVFEADATTADSSSDRPTATTTATTLKRRISTHQDAMALLTGHAGELSPKSKEFKFATNSVEQIKARGRRSDVFPQKRTVAKRSLSQSGDMDGVMGETSDKDYSRRRRTISMFEFMAAVSTSVTASVTTATIASSADIDVDPEEQGVAEGDGEDAEQAELLRLLGEGADAGGDGDGESSEEDVVDNGVEDVTEAAESDAFLDVKEESIQGSPRRRSGSFHSSMNTPVKRRQSFNNRMGSSSPGFGLYEQDEDEDEEDDEDDVMMISPKRIRVMQ